MQQAQTGEVDTTNEDEVVESIERTVKSVKGVGNQSVDYIIPWINNDILLHRAL